MVILLKKWMQTQVDDLTYFNKKLVISKAKTGLGEWCEFA